MYVAVLPSTEMQNDHYSALEQVLEIRSIVQLTSARLFHLHIQICESCCEIENSICDLIVECVIYCPVKVL